MSKSKHKKKPKSQRTPYSKASDDEKVRRNWNKACGLYKRGEWSVAVLRSGTCLELAVNFAIRQELIEERDLPVKFVNNLLLKANGLSNKYHNIYLPIMKEWELYPELTRLWSKDMVIVNRERNKVAHSGEFKTEKIAKKVLTHTHKSISAIMGLYGIKSKSKLFET